MSDEIKKYLKGKSVLLVTEVATDRTAWKKLFVEFGIALNDIHNAGTENEALDIINSKNIDILFSSYTLGKETSKNVIDEHMSKYPNRDEYMIFLVSEKNSLTVATMISEMEVDGLILKPYNQQDLINSVNEIITNKMNVSDDIRAYHHIMGLIRDESYDDALAEAKSNLETHIVSTHAHYVMGLAELKKENTSSAIDFWKKGLELDNKSYFCLAALFDIYCKNKEFKKAYEVAESLTEHFPINPKRIPDLIRASLATGNYHNLVSFCEMIISLDEDLELVKKPVGAALALSGKNIIQQNPGEHTDLIKQISKKAIDLSDKDSRIFSMSLENLISAKCFDEAKSYLERIATDEMGIDLLGVELSYCYEVEGADKSFIMAQEFIRDEKLSPKIFTIYLESAIKIERKKEQLEDIVFEAAKHFPELKETLMSKIS